MWSVLGSMPRASRISKDNVPSGVRENGKPNDSSSKKFTACLMPIPTLANHDCIVALYFTNHSGNLAIAETVIASRVRGYSSRC